MTEKKKDTKPTGLDLMRKKFDSNQISKLPKPTRAQTEAVKADFKKGIRCKICGGWHHPDVIHLDYVGHAALTDRMLECDQNWTWEPVAFDQNGCPFLDGNGGIWIRLTVCNMTRLGYGHPDGKKGGDAVKEAIGDALRNAAMRFGAALDLWHKGDLHADDLDDSNPSQGQAAKPAVKQGPLPDKVAEGLIQEIDSLDYTGITCLADLEEIKVKGRAIYERLTTESKSKLMAALDKADKVIDPANKKVK